jgi:tetratricopeptide (TPR) repeat protein
MYFDWDFPAAAESFRKAIALNPNYATAYHWNGILLTALGRFDEAGRQLKSALRSDPLSAPIQTDIGFYLHYRGRNAEAITALEEALTLNPGFPFTRFWLGRVHGAEGRCEQAFAELNAMGPAFEAWQPILAAKGYLSARCGDRKAAVTALDSFQTLSESRYVTSYGVALVYAGLGDREQALAWLEKAYNERSHWMVWLALDPRWSEIRGDARFQRLLTRIGLA